MSFLEANSERQECRPGFHIYIFLLLPFVVPFYSLHHVHTYRNTSNPIANHPRLKWQVPARFQFLPKPGQQESHKRWLWIDPQSDMIMPGASKDVGLSVIVDGRSANALNTNTDSIDDILILHLENGKDLFITISGTYLRTFFCTPLEDLVCVPIPIRQLPLGPISRKVVGSAEDVSRLHIPKELWLLVDYLYRQGLSTSGLFLTSGNRKSIWAVMEALDLGHSIPDGADVHSVAETLVRLLDSLPESVIPSGLYRRCMDCISSVVLCRQIVNELSLASQCVFIYILAFLRELLRHSNTVSPSAQDAISDNVVTSEKLSLIFGSLLLRPTSRDHLRGRQQVAATSDDRAIQSKRQAAFIHHFLIEESSL